jgi:dolichyl-diphosphooligosaccharide--protein glycosyltransferase
MSTWSERLDDEEGFAVVRGWLADYYHYLTLALLLGFALFARTLNWQRFTAGGTTLYSGNDPFYHFRSVQYAVNNWPATMPFDPWTNFAVGTSNSQFGTLFDQLIATGALIVGLGNPSEAQIRLVVLFAPAVFGTLTIVPAYVISRRLGGRFAGVVGAAVVAFATGALYGQGFVGTSDHHVAEALFQAIAVLGTMVAVSVAQAEKPVYELLAEREFGAIDRTIGWSLLAGAGIGTYLLVWPPGVLLLGILGVFYGLYLSVAFLRGHSPEHVAIAGAISMLAAGIIALSTTNEVAVSATSRSLLQPGLAFAVAAGCAFMAWLARVWDERDLSTFAYPATVVGVVVVLAGLLAVLLPTVFDFLLKNVLRVMGLGYGTTATAATVGEISQMPLGELTEAYKLAAVVAVAGVLYVLVRQVTHRDPPAQELLVAIWFVFVLLASLTQSRFAYYLTIPVAGLTALVAGRAVRYVIQSDSGDRLEAHQLLSIGAVLLLVLVPMVAFPPTVVGSAPNKAPGSVQGWQPSLEYMQAETPEPGTYANPGGEPMDYLGTVDRTADFDYPEGAYGVMSWWDYGHWITANGQRIPVANPFQQGANVAADFLLAQNETEADAALAEREEPDAKTRFVMVDWKMVETANFYGGKFFAPPTFKDGVNRSDFYTHVINREILQQTGNLRASTVYVRQKQPYYRSLMVRLYHYHGSAMEPRPVVVEWQGQEQPLRGGGTITDAGASGQGPAEAFRRFESMAEARDYVSEAPSVRQIGGVGVYPTERVPALQHYRLVHVSDFSAAQGQSYVDARLRTLRNSNLQSVLGEGSTPQGALSWLAGGVTPSWTKSFERVPGATIEGSGPADTTVRASVRLEANQGAPFTYTQQARTDADGDFTMTVPYATTGDEAWGPAEGYANSAVSALGPYNVTTATTVENGTGTRWFGQVDVTEGQVLGEDDSAATVTLEEQSRTIEGEGAQGNEASADGADGNDGTSSDGGNASGRLSPPPEPVAPDVRVGP